MATSDRKQSPSVGPVISILNLRWLPHASNRRVSDRYRACESVNRDRKTRDAKTLRQTRVNHLVGI